MVDVELCPLRFVTRNLDVREVEGLVLAVGRRGVNRDPASLLEFLWPTPFVFLRSEAYSCEIFLSLQVVSYTEPTLRIKLRALVCNFRDPKARFSPSHHAPFHQSIVLFSTSTDLSVPLPEMTPQ